MKESGEVILNVKRSEMWGVQSGREKVKERQEGFSLDGKKRAKKVH